MAMQRKKPARHKVTRKGKTFWRGKGSRILDASVYHDAVARGNYRGKTFPNDEIVALGEKYQKLADSFAKGEMTEVTFDSKLTSLSDKVHTIYYSTASRGQLTPKHGGKLNKEADKKTDKFFTNLQAGKAPPKAQ